MTMKKARRLKLAKETLHSLEDPRLKTLAGATGESICWCITQLCITREYTNCNLCDS
jgi:hypothetical protein